MLSSPSGCVHKMQLIASTCNQLCARAISCIVWTQPYIENARVVEKLLTPKFELNRITFRGRAMTMKLQLYVAPLFCQNARLLSCLYLVERKYKTDNSKYTYIQTWAPVTKKYYCIYNVVLSIIIHVSFFNPLRIAYD